jgi:hypothetical protein
VDNNKELLCPAEAIAKVESRLEAIAQLVHECVSLLSATTLTDRETMDLVGKTAQTCNPLTMALISQHSILSELEDRNE